MNTMKSINPMVGMDILALGRNLSGDPQHSLPLPFLPTSFLLLIIPQARVFPLKIMVGYIFLASFFLVLVLDFFFLTFI